ncbi:MAG: guanylate kinase [Proteobacteria bacterium]|nr:guanylate kinase [Candidatus Fonsibacter sp. PEL5]NKA16981.1 guanylate kinase [Candidatus Fonsibacter sp. PEL55]
MISKSKRGLILILSSPSGAGKTTLAKKIEISDSNFKISVSYTTRTPRLNEINGVDYNFISINKFEELSNQNKFLEQAKVFGNYYGTLKEPIEENLVQGKDYIFDIDWQGTEQVKKIMPLDIVPIFILPPSINDLENRLKKREEKNKELIDQRMKMAKDEINHWKDYKYIVVNKNLENCFEQITKIVKIERELRSTFN